MHTLNDLYSGALHGARHVRLTNLGLKEFPSELFRLCETLELLDLSGNQLSEFPHDFARFKHLRILFASNNPFTEFPKVLGDCPQLEMVGFKACQIQKVPEGSLPARLRWLILTDNQLSELPKQLGQCQRLQKLMLSCNQLQSLPNLMECQQLELLRIASNSFTDIPEQLLQAPALSWLAMAGNPLTHKSEHQALDTSSLASISYQNLEIGKLLGEGASGHIYQATLKDTGEAVALKCFKAMRTSDGTPHSELAAGLCAGRHAHLLTPCAKVTHHPHGDLASVFPLLPPGYINLAQPPSLESCTRDVYAPHTRFTQSMAHHLLHCIRSAIHHMHNHRVLHGDLYAHNILWNPSRGDAILSDFGAATLPHDLPAKFIPHLQALEWRAYRHLETEVMARCTG